MSACAYKLRIQTTLLYLTIDSLQKILLRILKCGIHSYIYAHAILEITSKVTSQKTMSSLKLEHPTERTPQQAHFF